MEKPGWIARTTATSKPRATWAAVALAAVSLLVQGVNFVKTDLKPLLEAARQNAVALERIEHQVEKIEHQVEKNNRRITALEEREPPQKVFRRQK